MTTDYVKTVYDDLVANWNTGTYPAEIKYYDPETNELQFDDPTLIFVIGGTKPIEHLCEGLLQPRIEKPFVHVMIKYHVVSKTFAECQQYLITLETAFHTWIEARNYSDCYIRDITYGYDAKRHTHTLDILLQFIEVT